MHFLISDTFTDSLARLTGDEQKSAKTTAFDLQINPAHPGHSFHKLDGAKDKNFWSVRASSDLRIIVHKTSGSLLLCYVDHHDKAYDWAERRKLETHPKTGAAQIVEIRETVQEILVPVYVQAQLPLPAKKPLFAKRSDDELLGYGVPEEWLNDVRQATEDSLLILADRLPAEAAEALLVTRDYAGPARVSGSAGTGKTIVALHRAVHLARSQPDARVLLATFTDALAHALRTKLKRLVGSEPRLGERIDVHSLESLAVRLHKAQIGPVQLATRQDVKAAIRAASDAIPDHRFALQFLFAEWEHVVDAWNLASWEEYRDVARLGRKTRLPEAQRSVLWSIFERTLSELKSKGLTTPSSVFTALASIFTGKETRPFDLAVVDEAQDLSISQLRFFAALGGDRPNSLFFAGDIGQRIFQQPFSWKSLGVDIRGRSRNLRVNYRTSHQIRQQADRLLGPEITDADGNREDRSDTVSVFNGPPPVIQVFAGEGEEQTGVAEWLRQQSAAGLLPHEFGVFVRSDGQLPRAEAALRKAGLSFKILDDHVETASGHVSISTMHLAKGLEFRAVVVMACDDEVVPLQERIESVGDDSDLQEVYETERHLLYVACTRARDQLLITSVEPASEFLDDLLRR